MDYLSQLDNQLLLWLNSHHNAFCDSLMWVISSRAVWIPLYVLMAYAVVRRYSWRAGLLIIICIGAAVGLSDFVCASVIRPQLHWMRPSNPDNPISPLVHIVNNYRGGSYGFPSCHASNTFALALFFSLVMHRRWITVAILSWSVLVCYSRIYLGVHYPGDILGGMLVGSVVTLFIYRLECRFLSKHPSWASRHIQDISVPPRPNS